MQRASGYSRVSTLDQAEHGFSLEEQERAMRDDSQRHDETWVDLYVDAGVSGRKTETRRELQRMLTDAEAGCFEVLLIPSLDRLGRNARDLYSIFDRLDQAGVTIRSLRGDVDTSTATGKLTTGVMASLAQFESDVIGERVRNGKASAARKGRPNGGRRSYGFRPGDGQLVPVKDEVQVAERIFREFVACPNQTQIAVRLNADGLRTAEGKRWTQSQISGQLHNPKWIGKIRNSEGIFDSHDAIIDIGLWNQAQVLLTSGGKHLGRPSGQFLLAKLLKCGRCGSTMRVMSESKSYGLYQVYACSGRHLGRTVCDQSVVSRELIDRSVLNFFEIVGLDLDAMVAELAGERDRRLTQIRTRRDRAHVVLRTAEGQIDRLDTLLRKGEIGTDEWRRLVAVPDSELEAARGACENLEQEEQAVFDATVIADATEAALERLAVIRAAAAGAIRDADSVQAAQAALRRVFKSFVLYDGRHSFPMDEERYIYPPSDEMVIVPIPHEEMVVAQFALNTPQGPIYTDEFRRVPIEMGGGGSRASSR